MHPLALFVLAKRDSELIEGGHQLLSSHSGCRRVLGRIGSPLLSTRVASSIGRVTDLSRLRWSDSWILSNLSPHYLFHAQPPPIHVFLLSSLASRLASLASRLPSLPLSVVHPIIAIDIAAVIIIGIASRFSVASERRRHG